MSGGPGRGLAAVWPAELHAWCAACDVRVRLLLAGPAPVALVGASCCNVQRATRISWRARTLAGTQRQHEGLSMQVTYLGHRPHKLVCKTEARCPFRSFRPVAPTALLESCMHAR